MKDLSQALISNIDPIITNWIEAMRQDGQIETSRGLDYEEVRNSLPYVLRDIASILSVSEEDNIGRLVKNSLEHGKLRAKQHYDASEMAREYQIVRRVILETLKPDLINVSPEEMFRAIHIINTALDEVLARCFRSYTKERLLELEKIQQQLLLTNQELTRLVASEQENLAYFTHELKNPLNIILGYSELLLRRRDLAEKDYAADIDLIERVLKHGRQLLQVITNALEISRYAADQLKLSPEPTNLCSLTEAVLKSLEQLAQEKQLQLHYICTLKEEQVTVDALRLQQIISNLVSNAIRYTESGTVTVSCQEYSENRFAIVVSDTGRGIAREDQAAIFEPYCQVETDNHAPGSTGLGLAIVSRLVKLMQGEIHLDSQVGVGSTFTVVFPRA